MKSLLLLFLSEIFFRLTPAFMMMVGILQLNSAWYSKTSQFYMDEKPHETCEKYWWRNLLYINNLYDRKELVRVSLKINLKKNSIQKYKKKKNFSYVFLQCMSWSWYLANDMQFFTIAVALLILSTM